MSRLARLWPTVLAALLGVAALLELGLLLAQRRAVPARADWWAAARAVRGRLQPGDLIVTAPGWADPLGRLVLGDRMSLDDVSRPDAATYRRVFELSVRGARHPDTRGARRVWRRRFGRVTASLYEKTPVRVAFDFYRELHRARVWEQRGARRSVCDWTAARQRFDCGARWKSVRQVRAEIGYQARQCILALPIDGAARVIEFDRVPLGTRLTIYTGLHHYDPRYRARRAIWDYARYRAGRRKKGRRPPRPNHPVPVTLEVQVDDRRVARLAHGVADETWHRHVIRLPAAPAARVRFRITTRYAWAKHFCFYARSEGAAP